MNSNEGMFSHKEKHDRFMGMIFQDKCIYFELIFPLEIVFAFYFKISFINRHLRFII